MESKFSKRIKVYHNSRGDSGYCLDSNKTILWRDKSFLCCSSESMVPRLNVGDFCSSESQYSI